MFRAWVIAVGAIAVHWGCSSTLASVAPGAAPAPVSAAQTRSALTPESEPALTNAEPGTQAWDVAEAPAPRTEIVEPAAIACRISEKAWTHMSLRLRADGPSFASVVKAPGALLLPAGDDPTEAIAVIDDGAILLRAVIAKRDVRLYLPKPQALLGIVTPAAIASLDWVSASAGKLRVGVANVADVLLTPNPFEAELGCSQVVIEPRDYDARASITRRKNLQTRETARDGVELRATQTGPVAATLRAGVGVGLVEVRGAAVRVLIDGGDHYIAGWVAKTDLVGSPGPGMMGLQGIGAGGGRGRGAYPFTLRCPVELDLYVERGAERIKVGSVHAGTPFHPAGGETPNGHFVPIAIPGVEWLWLHRNARFTVEGTSLHGCTKH
jgi:hypothetical protein